MHTWHEAYHTLCLYILYYGDAVEWLRYCNSLHLMYLHSNVCMCVVITHGQLRWHGQYVHACTLTVV